MPPAPPLARVVTPTLPDDWPDDGFGDVGQLTSLLPDPDELGEGLWLGVNDGPPRQKGLFARFQKRRFVALPVRCAALLARGYVDVGAGEVGGEKLAWGRAPTPQP